MQRYACPVNAPEKELVAVKHFFYAEQFFSCPNYLRFTFNPELLPLVASESCKIKNVNFIVHFVCSPAYILNEKYLIL